MTTAQFCSSRLILLVCDNNVFTMQSTWRRMTSNINSIEDGREGEQTSPRLLGFLGANEESLKQCELLNSQIHSKWLTNLRKTLNLKV